MDNYVLIYYIDPDTVSTYSSSADKVLDFIARRKLHREDYTVIKGQTSSFSELRRDAGKVPSLETKRT